MFFSVLEEILFSCSMSCCCCFSGLYFFNKKFITDFEIMCLFEESLNKLLQPSNLSWSLSTWGRNVSKYHEDYNLLRYALKKKIYDALKKNASKTYFQSEFIKMQLMMYLIQVLFQYYDIDNVSIEFQLIELDNSVINSFYNYTDTQIASLETKRNNFWKNFAKQSDGSSIDLQSTDKTIQKMLEKKLIQLLINCINEKINFDNILNIILKKTDEIEEQKKQVEESFMSLNSTA